MISPANTKPVAKASKSKEVRTRSTTSSSASSSMNKRNKKSRWKVGAPVLVRRKEYPLAHGTITYLGKVRFCEKHDDWVGVCLTGDSEGTGKNNGTVDGVKYFECNDGCGLFARKKHVGFPTMPEKSLPSSPSSRKSKNSKESRRNKVVSPSSTDLHKKQKKVLSNESPPSNKPKVKQGRSGKRLSPAEREKQLSVFLGKTIELHVNSSSNAELVVTSNDQQSQREHNYDENSKVERSTENTPTPWEQDPVSPLTLPRCLRNPFQEQTNNQKPKPAPLPPMVPLMIKTDSSKQSTPADTSPVVKNEIWTPPSPEKCIRALQKERMEALKRWRKEKKRQKSKSSSLVVSQSSSRRRITIV